MALVNNPWVGYLERSFEQSKASLLAKLVVNNPEITDHSESNILVVIVSMFAGLVEMLNYYIDNMAREAFISTARQFNSMVKLTRVLDYRIKASVASSVDITFTALDAGSLPVGLTVPATIPAGTAVQTANGIIFLTNEDLNFAAGQSAATVGAKQIAIVTGVGLGTTDGSANQAFNLSSTYVNGTLSITIDGTLWQLKDTLGLSTPTSKHYIVEVDVDGTLKVLFGNGTFGEIPPSPFTVFADYEETGGENVDANTITTINDTIAFIALDAAVNSVIVNNLNASSGASGIEDIESIRQNAPLSIRTLNRAVTKTDYRDVTVQAAGVAKAGVDYDCGKFVDVYIAPTGGGIASQALIDLTSEYLECRKMITTFIDVRAAGETEIAISADVTAKFREAATATKTDVENALVDFLSFANSDINRKVRLSDIIALIDNLAKVDFVDLTRVSSIPYALPTNHDLQLDWSRITNVGSTAIIRWRLEFDGVNFRVFKDTVYQGILGIGVLFVDDAINFTINAGAYILGNKWEFTSYPFLENIELDDFSVPRISNVVNLAITVTAQNIVDCD